MATFDLSNQKQKTLLIVDDEELIRNLCASALQEYRLLIAENGNDALKFLEVEDVDIVLSDVVMPTISGIDLLKKAKLERPNQAFILMTGYSDKETILHALKEGADDFISKPINVLQLSTTVKKVLEKQKIRDELADLKRSEKLKNDFLGLISHKLKTPATALSLFIQNLAEGVESPDDKNFQLMLEMVQKETLHLEQLIQDLLFFSTAILQEEDLDLGRFDLSMIVQQVSLVLAPSAAGRNIDFLVNVDALQGTLLALNHQRVSFAVRALIDNAIKFTPEGGQVTIIGEVNDDRARLTISDTGSGIPPLELSKIFNKFYQIDPERTGQVRGFGLGLYYARNFIRSMGGQLQLISEPGNGTQAVIEFPLSQ
jgi:signal transduction histidine kinase